MDRILRGRTPDFVIIGAMKSGTTTLWNWLAEHPCTDLSTPKEPNLLLGSQRSARAGYKAMYESIAGDSKVGECSVLYMDPLRADHAASVAGSIAPDTRILAILRDPRSRLLSHFHHRVLRGREHRTLAEAVRDPASPYVRTSMYASGLRPWFDAGFAPLALRFEDLFGARDDHWTRLLSHLDLPPTARPTRPHNVTSERRQYSPLMRAVYDSRARALVPRVPARMRPLANRLAFSQDRTTQAAETDIPWEVVRVLAHDAAELPNLCGSVDLEWPGLR